MPGVEHLDSADLARRSDCANTTTSASAQARSAGLIRRSRARCRAAGRRNPVGERPHDGGLVERLAAVLAARDGRPRPLRASTATTRQSCSGRAAPGGATMT